MNEPGDLPIAELLSQRLGSREICFAVEPDERRDDREDGLGGL